MKEGLIQSSILFLCYLTVRLIMHTFDVHDTNLIIFISMTLGIISENTRLLIIQHRNKK